MIKNREGKVKGAAMYRTGICEQTSQTPTQEFQVAELKHCFPRSPSSFHYSEEHHQGMLGWLIQLKINEVKCILCFPNQVNITVPATSTS